jgi:hypothetical protein
MAKNPYFKFGTNSEQNVVENLIIECLQIYGQEMFYIPRTLVSKDEILGEDRLSEFKNAYPIEMYFENVDGFGGNGAFMSKFGLMIEQSATLVVARKRWQQAVAQYGQTILPNRPAEGDLLYFPLTGGLFEIKFVQHQNPFYQIGKLYTYKLDIELFQYASERIDTGYNVIDDFESLKTFDIDPSVTKFGMIDSIQVTNGGTGYTSATVSIKSTTGKGATATAVISNGAITAINVTNPGTGYQDVTVVITGDGSDATATATLINDIDKVESYGDNNSFKREAESFIFNDRNPFGEVDPD